MAVPKKKKSRSRRGNRRSHDALVGVTHFHLCPHCGATKLSHHVCMACGQYRGRQVLAMPAVEEPVSAAE